MLSLLRKPRGGRTNRAGDSFARLDQNKREKTTGNCGKSAACRMSYGRLPGQVQRGSCLVEACEALAGVVALPQEQEREQEPEQEPEQGPERAEQEQGQEPELAEQEQKQELAEAVETLAGVKLQLRAGNGRLRVGHGKGHRVERRGRSLERRKRCGCLV